MNSRERKLLISLGLVGFAMANVIGYKSYTQSRARVKTEISEAETSLEVARFAQEQADTMQSEIDWLEKNTPQAKEAELVPSQLQSFVTGRATSAGLITTNQRILENTTDGNYFDRARFRVSVTGKEQDLYQWLVAVHNPAQFRAVTMLRLSTNRQHDTQIDADVQVEEWFVAKTGEEPEDNLNEEDSP